MDGDDTNQRKEANKYQFRKDEEVVFEVKVSREEADRGLARQLTG